MPLRDFCAVMGWEIHDEYVDRAPANDLAHRVRWRDMLDDAAKKEGHGGAGFQAGPGFPQRKAHARHL